MTNCQHPIHMGISPKLDTVVPATVRVIASDGYWDLCQPCTDQVVADGIATVASTEPGQCPDYRCSCRGEHDHGFTDADRLAERHYELENGGL